jgi:hypothetical protein
MPQFPALKDQLAAWTDAVQSRRDHLLETVSDLASRTQEATVAVPATAAGLVARTRSRCEEIPLAMVGEIRRRINVLDLATRHDVEAQSRIGRSRVSFVLKEFLEEQRGHDEELVKTMRSELQEELRCFASAIGDELFAGDRPREPSGGGERPWVAPLNDLGDDEELDLVGYYGIRPTEDDVDLLADE